MMLQLKLGVLTNTALQTGTICGEQRSPKKREGTGSVIFGPALLLLLAACGGGGGGGGGVSVANPEPADTNETPTDETPTDETPIDETPTDDARVTVNAGPVDAEGVSHQETANTKIDIVAEALQDVSLSAVYKSGDDGADITLEFVDMQNQLRHSFTITNIDEDELDITVDNKPISIQFGTNNEGFTDDDLSGANNYTSVLDGGEGNDTLNGGDNNHNLFGFSGKNFGHDTIVNPNRPSNRHFNNGDIISFIEYVLKRPTDDVRERADVDFVTPEIDINGNLKLSTKDNGASVTVENAAYLVIGIRSSHGNVENFIYALSNPLRGTSLPDIILGGNGVNKIKALGGNDEIKAGGGSDEIDAGKGDDYIEGGAGADEIDGGTGIDTASYEDASAAIRVFMLSLISNQGDARGDSYDSIENIIGSDYNDVISGNSEVNHIQGGAGDDRLDGYEGNDILTGGAGNDIFVTSFVSGQEETITDFTKGEDKIRINVSDTSAVNDLNSLFRDDSIKYLSTTITDYTGNDKNDTVLRFDRGAEGESDADYILVFEGFADALEYSDFSVF